jgi:uncharacterized protein YukE
MGVAIRYDVDAGEQLSSLLAQLNDKLTALAQLRASLRSSQLDCNPGQWQGTARHQFEDDYASQQYRLGQLADTALTIKNQVDQANQQASDLQHKTGTNIS